MFKLKENLFEMNLLLFVCLTGLPFVITGSSSYQYVKFIHEKKPIPTSGSRSSRSFHYTHAHNLHPIDGFGLEHFWPEPELTLPRTNGDFLDVTLPLHHGHAHNSLLHDFPDFSNGLSYPDPYLITGLAAKRAAQYLYSKELFFDKIPHARNLLKLNEKRKDNGLPPNRLGSLSYNSPFYRNAGKNYRNFYSAY